MMRRWALAAALLGLAVAASGAASAQTCPQPSAMPPETTQPQPQMNAKREAWIAQILERAQRGPYEALAFGDSTVQRWRPPLLDAALGGRTLNAGVGGYGTEGVLWLLQNQNLGPQHPKRILLQLGFGDLRAPACDIYWGLRADVAELHRRYPGATVILTSILPFGALPRPMDGKIALVNRALAEDRKDYVFFNVHDEVAAACAGQPMCPLYMPHDVHLSPAGYQLLTSRLQTLLGTGAR